MAFVESSYRMLLAKRCCCITSILLSLSALKSPSQNLVPDPGFENYISCPTNFTVTASPPEPLTAGWFIPTMGTSDYFNSCAIGTPAYMPQNFFGTQDASEGEGYAGIFVFSNNNPNYREYVESELSVSLTAGQTYEVGFYVSFADSSDVYIKELGAHLSGVGLVGSYSHNIAVAPQILNSNGFLSDENNWVLVKGYYTASGGERYITIGNFHPDITLDFSNFPNMAPDDVAYYYLDSVYVSPCIFFDAGANGTTILCSNSDPVDLTDYLTGAESGGVWIDPNGNIFQNPIDPSQDIAGTYRYMGGQGFCADTSELIVNITPVPSAGDDGFGNVCSNTDLFNLLTGNPSPGGTWLAPSGVPFSNPFDPSANAPGDYSYIVGNASCYDTSHLFVHLNQPVDASFTATPHEGCLPFTVTFDAAYSIPDLQDAIWNFGDGNIGSSDPAYYQYSDSGCYIVELLLITAGGCVGDTTINDAVCVHPTPTADFSFSPSFPSLDDPTIFFTNLSEGADHYAWQFGTLAGSADKDPTLLFPLEEATHSICLIAMNDYGCADTICKGISFTYGPTTLVIPNAFTPNGDGLNDEFKIYGKWLDQISLKIFNRWGNEVFETTDREEGWNGTFKNKAQGEGVYVYYVQAHFLDGNQLKRQGTVTLLR